MKKIFGLDLHNHKSSYKLSFIHLAVFKPPGWGSAIRCPLRPHAKCSLRSVYLRLTIRLMLPRPNRSHLMHPVVISGEINSRPNPLVLSHIFRQEHTPGMRWLNATSLFLSLNAVSLATVNWTQPKVRLLKDEITQTSHSVDPLMSLAVTALLGLVQPITYDS